MAYTKTNWVNGGPPAIDATNLNKIEQGIYDCDAGVSNLDQQLTGISFKKVTAVTSGTTVNIPNNYRGIIWVIDSNTTNCGEYIIFSTGSGVMGSKAVLAASNLTIDTSVNNKIKFTPASGTRVILFLNVQGTPTV